MLTHAIWQKSKRRTHIEVSFHDCEAALCAFFLVCGENIKNRRPPRDFADWFLLVSEDHR